MNECVIIKKENLQQAYENGCEDVQEVLKDLFPDDVGEKKDKFCCGNFETYYDGTPSHKKFIFDSQHGDYYVFPDIDGYGVQHCPTCGAQYDGKKWTPRV